MTSFSRQLYPLTSMQRDVWLYQMFDKHQGVPVYNMGGYVKIPGRIDPALLEQAINLMIKKHDTLRTILTEVTDADGIPMQTYAEELTIKVPLQDFSKTPHPEQAAVAWMQERLIEPFTLIGQPLVSYDLIKISEECYYGFGRYHHIIIDGHAIGLITRSAAAIYTDLVQGKTPNLTSPAYTDYIAYDQAEVEPKLLEKERQYWLSQYSTCPERLLTSQYRTQYPEQSDCESAYLPRDFYNRLGTLAKANNATLFHVFIGVLYVYFTNAMRHDTFVIGLPILNRPSAKYKQTAGLFMTVTPVLLDFGRALTFAELLQKIYKALKVNYRYRRLSIGDINQLVGLEGRWQFFDVMFSYQLHDYDACFDGIHSQTIPLLSPWEQTPLFLFVRDFNVETAVSLDFIYNYAYFKTSEIKALQADIVALLTAILDNSTMPISDYSD